MDTLPHIQFRLPSKRALALLTAEMRVQCDSLLPRSFLDHYQRAGEGLEHGVYWTSFFPVGGGNSIIIELAVGTDRLVYGVPDAATGEVDYDYDTLLDAVIAGRFNDRMQVRGK